MSEDKMRDDGFEQWWREYGQFCRAGGGQYEETFAYEAWKACSAIKDAEIAKLNNRLRIEENAHAELQSRCFDQGGTFSNVFDELKQCKAEIAARDLMIKKLVADVASIIARAEQAMEQRTLVDIGTRVADILYIAREALAKSEHHNSRALEQVELPNKPCNEVLAGNGYCDKCAEGLYEQCRYVSPSPHMLEKAVLEASINELSFTRTAILAVITRRDEMLVDKLAELNKE